MMPETPCITVLCVDDHNLIREGVANMLGIQPDIKLVATASSGRDAIKQFELHKPDITLMDLRLPDRNGVEIMREIRSRHSGAKIIALTTYAGDIPALRSLRAGAMGYLLKSALRNELLDAIRAVNAGERRVSAEVAQNISEYLLSEHLSDREVEVLQSVAGGKTNKAVAKELRLSEETIRVHLKTIFAKLGAYDRTHAVVIAMRRGYFAL